MKIFTKYLKILGINLFLVLQLIAQPYSSDSVYYYYDNLIIDKGEGSKLSKSALSKTSSTNFEIIKSDFLVNPHKGNWKANKYRPNIASDSSGNILACWVDERNGKKDLFVQFFNKNLSPVGKNILVNESPYTWNLTPSVSTNKKGDFILTWARSSSEIFAQCFNNLGEKIGQNFKVNSDYGWNSNCPSAAIDEEGNFLIVWSKETYLGQGSKIFARMFNSNRIAQGPEFIVGDEEYSRVTSIGRPRNISFSRDGNYVVVWSTFHNDSSKIILQQIDKLGHRLGSSIVVSDLGHGYRSSFPSVSAIDSGYYFIAWEIDSSWHDWKTGGRLFHTDKHFVSEQLLFGDHNYSYSITNNKKNEFILFWNDYPRVNAVTIKKNNNISSVYSIEHDTTYTKWIDNFQIAGTESSTYLIYDNYQNIFLQRLDSQFLSITDGILVNDDKHSSFQIKPAVKFNRFGESIVIWEDKRNGSPDIYGQVFDASFNRVGDEFKINDETFTGSTKEKKISSPSDGSFIVAFTGNSGKLSLQRISRFGQKVFSNKIVDYYGASKIATVVNDRDEFIIVWNKGLYGINFQIFNSSLTSTSGIKELFKVQPDIKKKNINFSVNNKFDILYTWIDYDMNSSRYVSNYKALLVDKDSNPISDTLYIDDNLDVHTNLGNYISDNGGIIFFWYDNTRLNINRIYPENDISLTNYFYTFGSYESPQAFQIKDRKIFFALREGAKTYGYLLNDYNYSQEKYLIHDNDFTSSINGESFDAFDIDILDNKLMYVYESNKQTNTGFDIWGNVQKIDSLDFSKEIERFLPYENKMFPAFPNPFNASTTLAYEIVTPANVEISIYDVLGRKIKTLVDEFQETGLKQINFNTSSLSSGVYLCLFEAQTTSVQKLLLVK